MVSQVIKMHIKYDELCQKKKKITNVDLEFLHERKFSM